MENKESAMSLQVKFKVLTFKETFLDFNLVLSFLKFIFLNTFLNPLWYHDTLFNGLIYNNTKNLENFLARFWQIQQPVFQPKALTLGLL